MSDKSTCDKLAAELARNADGRELLDVKFDLGNRGTVASERLCDDVTRLLAADGVVLRTPKI